MPLSVPFLASRVISRMLCLMTAVNGEPPDVNQGQGWTIDDSSFGARLALVRQRMRWNIKEAARECGIPPASWANWEAGAMPRRYTEMCRLIAQRTGANYLWLIAGPDSRSIGPTRYLALTRRSPAGRDRPPEQRGSTRPGSGRPSPPVRSFTLISARVARHRPTRTLIQRKVANRRPSVTSA
jgi:transcriptional regulator with XRE-family HTH domain